MAERCNIIVHGERLERHEEIVCDSADISVVSSAYLKIDGVKCSGPCNLHVVGSSTLEIGHLECNDFCNFDVSQSSTLIIGKIESTKTCEVTVIGSSTAKINAGAMAAAMIAADHSSTLLQDAVTAESVTALATNASTVHLRARIRLLVKEVSGWSTMWYFGKEPPLEVGGKVNVKDWSTLRRAGD
jgi:hypothetical protein